MTKYDLTEATGLGTITVGCGFITAAAVVVHPALGLLIGGVLAALAGVLLAYAAAVAEGRATAKSSSESPETPESPPSLSPGDGAEGVRLSQALLSGLGGHVLGVSAHHGGALAGHDTPLAGHESGHEPGHDDAPVVA